MHPNIMKNALKLFPLSAFVLLSGHVQAQSSLTLFGKVVPDWFVRLVRVRPHWAKVPKVVLDCVAQRTWVRD